METTTHRKGLVPVIHGYMGVILRIIISISYFRGLMCAIDYVFIFLIS